MGSDLRWNKQKTSAKDTQSSQDDWLQKKQLTLKPRSSSKRRRSRSRRGKRNPGLKPKSPVTNDTDQEHNANAPAGSDLIAQGRQGRDPTVKPLIRRRLLTGF